MEFLVPLYKDLRLRRLVMLPITIFSEDSADIIPKSSIICDACGAMVAVDEKDLEDGKLPIGYALCDEEYFIEVVCEGCRCRYFNHLRCYNNLEEALGGE
ncbi:MAG: hypothetical protein QW521_05475 [Desulfurococcaceae archaeon]